MRTAEAFLGAGYCALFLALGGILLIAVWGA